jgi:hypothetical protein
LDQTIADEISGVQLTMAAAHDNLAHRRTRLVPLDHPEHGNKSGRKMSAQNPNRMLKNPSSLSFRGAAGDKESRKSFVCRARFLASLGMTAFTKVFQHPAKRLPMFELWNSNGTL